MPSIHENAFRIQARNDYYVLTRRDIICKWAFASHISVVHLIIKMVLESARFDVVDSPMPCDCILQNYELLIFLTFFLNLDTRINTFRSILFYCSPGLAKMII